MHDKSNYGKTGLLPLHRFIYFNDASDANLPDNVTRGAIEGLLEPEPSSWINHSIPMWKDIIWDFAESALGNNTENLLLKVSLSSRDEAYVFDREILGIDGYLHKWKNRPSAMEQFWNTKQSVFEYDGSFALPLVAVFNDINVSRLEVVDKISPIILMQRFVDPDYVLRVEPDVNIEDFLNW